MDADADSGVGAVCGCVGGVGVHTCVCAGMCLHVWMYTHVSLCCVGVLCGWVSFWPYHLYSTCK